MKNLCTVALIVTSFSLSLKNVLAQEECWDNQFENKLRVTKMVFNAAQDTLYVTIHNDCDTCDRNIYTGVIIYNGVFIGSTAVEDTLAIDNYYTSRWTPHNNSEATYTAVVKKDFKLSQNFKVGLVDVCPSIQLDLPNSMNVQKNQEKILLYNNAIHLTNHKQVIQNITVYNTAGQLVQKESGILSNEYKLQPVKPGLYVIYIMLSRGERVNLKYRVQ